MSDHLPSTLATLHDDAKTAEDRLATFRAYVALMNTAYKLLEAAREEARRAERRLNEIRVDYVFFLRHKARVETAFRALRDTYRNPAKALRMIEELVANYPAQYVFDVCQLGSYRFGTPHGWNLLGVRSEARIEADQNYIDAAIPALAQMLPDHAGYLDLRSKDIERLFEEAQAEANQARAGLGAIETALPGWIEEMTACALTLTERETKALSNSEREVRRRLMPAPKPTADPTADPAV